ncbi:ABC transporter substrate-binding protein [Azospirillum halopraeferens]|uniref:ABC transporter substrate-binding protein n=1 Tax=Azospirillum halopraeferens TaxID=34010 RepID=UPI0004009FD6|nr:ABC transporter substrate-binding protein [Azospirillum halopraeferens]
MKSKTLVCSAVLSAALAHGAPAQAADAIRIGVLNDQSGVFADNGGMGSVIAARLAVEDFGKTTVLGQPIEVISADHQNKADIASATARRWIDTEGVDLIADGAASSAGLAIQEVVRDRGQIFVVSGPASSDFTGKFCAPNSFHFNYDTYALAKITGKAVTEASGKDWYFIGADYAFGHALARDTTAFIEEAGGRVVGSVFHPLGTNDFSSYLLQAQASGAKIVGLATSGADAQTAIKQSAEFGIVESGQTLAGLLIFITDVHALGLDAAQGLQIASSFYWDHSDTTRAWAKRFMAASGGKPPSMVQAGVYSGVLHYLRALEAAGTDNPKAVAAKMHEMPVNDMYNKDIPIRADGRVLNDMHLYQVKAPAQSRYPFDYYTLISTTPGEQAFRPLAQSACPLVTKP